MVFGLERLFTRAEKPAAAPQAAGVSLEATIYDDAPSEDIAARNARLADRMRFICAISFQLGTNFKFGTGMLVGPDLVLTNYHVVQECVENPKAAFVRSMRCKFDYFRRKVGEPAPPGIDIGLADDWCVAARRFSPHDIDGTETGRAAEDLDYVLLRLDRPIGMEPLGDDTDADSGELRGWEPFPSPVRLPELSEPFTIMQHPVNPLENPPQYPQRISTNKVTAIVDNALRVRHDVTTSPGSSGSPCFGRNDAFVALHHGADRGEGGARPRWNQAIPMTAIVRDLAALKHDAILASRPPPDVAPGTARPAAAGQAARPDVQRVAARQTQRLVNVARMLLDRSRPETEVIRSRRGKGIVHVIVCREIDRHLRFLDRLTELSLLLTERGPRLVEQRRALLAAATREAPVWSRLAFDRPARQLSDERRIADVLEQAGEPDSGGKRWLAEIVTPIGDCSFESESALVTGVAARLAERFSPEQLQVVFVYHDPDSTAAADTSAAKRRQFAAMWAAEAPPAGCGVALQLEDVGPSELTAWSSDLAAAWDLDEVELRDGLDGAFGDSELLAMSEVERRLDELIRSSVEAALARG